MKKIVLFFVFFIVVTFSNNDLISCPPNYDSLVTSVWVQGCEFHIKICFKCPSPTSSADMRVSEWSKVEPGCPLNLSATEIYAAICDQVFDYTFIKARLCPFLDSIPPCSEGGQYMQYSYDRCWVKYNEGNGIFKYYPCPAGNCLCIEIWKWCWTPLPPPGRIIPVLSEGPYKACNYECPNTEPDNSEVLLNQESSCFNLGTPCDPW